MDVTVDKILEHVPVFALYFKDPTLSRILDDLLIGELVVKSYTKCRNLAVPRGRPITE